VRSQQEAVVLDLVSAGVISLWLQGADCTPQLDVVRFWPTPEVPWSSVEGAVDGATDRLVQPYLRSLAGQGVEIQAQGLWLQTGSQFLLAHQGSQRFPAASLTKVATSWAALQTWGVAHRFETVVLATGPIQDGVLQGDLVVLGGGDPALVAEAAIALGNQLHQLGLRQVTGGLAIAGDFWLDFQADPQKSGEAFKKLINAKAWSGETEAIFQSLPVGTPRPQVAIAGPVAVVSPQAIGADLPVLLRYPSLPVVRLLKLMNTHSSNFLAEALATRLGGPGAIVAAATQAGVPPEEIQLKNGSGLGPENQLSARAVCTLFAAIQHYLYPLNFTVADIFPVAGTDQGTLEDRTLPRTAVVKTGSLRDVSALAGVLPTRDRGWVWFTILNRGGDIQSLRRQQDRFLQTLVQQWGKANPATVIAAKASRGQPEKHNRPIMPWNGGPTAGNDGAETRDRLIEAAVDLNSRQQ
jgi:serine-type D-Ala-D-Ala carboxypeptidase/endopeptidase (penicillin-binding protein 4)